MSSSLSSADPILHNLHNPNSEKNSKVIQNQKPDPKSVPQSENLEKSDDNDELNNKKSEAKGQIREEEDEDEEEFDCGTCAVMEFLEAGSCRADVLPFKRCLRSAKNEEDVIKCTEFHLNLMNCVYANADFYGLQLEVEEADQIQQEKRCLILPY